MRITTYSDMDITVLAQTPNPQAMVLTGMQTCMKQNIVTLDSKASKSQIEYLLKSEHMSPLEHAGMTIYARGISRSLLAQITRQRTFKFTSSSQHYQDYSEYPLVVHNSMLNFEGPLSALNKRAIHHMESGVALYSELLEAGMNKEDARQILPNASGVNLMITADARNMTYFFRQRRCERNVEEMITFADTWWKLACEWFPELFSLVGAPCYMDSTGACNQGRMQHPGCKVSIEPTEW